MSMLWLSRYCCAVLLLCWRADVCSMLCPPKQAMKKIGLKTPPSGTAETMEDALRIADEIGSFPLIIRPAFTLGGTGGGIAYNVDEFKEIVEAGIFASLTNQVRQKRSSSVSAPTWSVGLLGLVSAHCSAQLGGPRRLPCC